MTIEELASASGSTVGDIQQLESFGLVAGRLVGGVAYYDEGALAIARTAAGFARFGVEARHLRFHKHAAEREAGFIEQIVLPLLKQRNPEARQRAQDNVAELSRLGQSLRMQLLRTRLPTRGFRAGKVKSLSPGRARKASPLPRARHPFRSLVGTRCRLPASPT